MNSVDFPMKNDNNECSEAEHGHDFPIGEQVRRWRNRAHISQMELALECDTSSRHLSFVETGRAHPSRKLLLSLMEYMHVPLRSRNAMLITAGYAPLYEETGLSDPEMAQVQSMLSTMIQQTAHFPSMLIDRHFNILESNLAFDEMCRSFAHDPALLEQEPLNLMRCFLNPDCLGNSVANYAEMYQTMVNRLRRFLNVMGENESSAELLKELLSYQPSTIRSMDEDLPHLVMPLRLRRDGQELNLFTMVTTIGAPLNITLQEVQLEFGLPMDAASETFLKEMVAAAKSD